MSRKPSIPASLDANKLAAMAAPLNVRLVRLRPGGAAPEVIPLPQDGNGWPVEHILGIEKHIPEVAGGGDFHGEVTSGNGEKLEWRFFIPGRQVVPGETRAAADIAEARARHEAAQAQATYGQPQNPFTQQGYGGAAAGGFAQPYPPIYPWPGGAAPQPWGQPPPMQPYGAPPQPRFDPFTGRPFPPGQPPPYMPGFEFYYPAQMPPQAPPVVTSPSALPPEVAARLQRIEEQNQTLREEKIRREASAPVEQMMREFNEYRRQNDAKFDQLIEKLTASMSGRNSSAQGDEELRRQLDEMRRQLDVQRVDAERRISEQRLTDENKRREDELRRELQRVEDQRRVDAENLRREIETTKSQGGQTELLRVLMDAQREAQREASARMTETLARYGGDQLKPLDLLKLMQEISANNKDPITAQVLNAAVDNLLNGGGGASTAQVIAGALTDGVKVLGGAWAETKTAEAKAKAMVESRARQRAEAVGRAVQTPESPPPVAPVNGHNAPAQGVAAVPEVSAVPLAGAAKPDGRTAVELLEEEERPYFGDLYGHVKQLRVAVASGVLDAEKCAYAIGEVYIAFASFAVITPALKDLKEDPRKVISYALPDAPTAYRMKVIELVPGAIAEAERRFQEEAAADGEGEGEGEEPKDAPG